MKVNNMSYVCSGLNLLLMIYLVMVNIQGMNVI